MRLHELNNNKNTIYFMMVYANPPTYGYKLAYEKLLKVSKDANHVVFINPMVDSEINPLSFKKNLSYNKALFPSVNFNEAGNIKTPLEALKYLSNEYDIIYLVTKDENIKEYRRYTKYAENWGVYDFDVIGLGDSKSDDTKGRTNKLARKYVLDNNYQDFKNTIPTDNERLMSSLYLDLRKAMLTDSKQKNDEVTEQVNKVIETIREKNSGFSVIEEYFSTDQEGNRYIMLNEINNFFKNIKLVVSNKYKDYSIAKDKDKNYVIFINSSLKSIDKKLTEDADLFEKTIRNTQRLDETTAGAIASSNAVLGQPIKRIPNSDESAFEFVKKIKYDRSCRDKLNASMGEFINRNGYIDQNVIKKIKEILDK